MHGPQIVKRVIYSLPASVSPCFCRLSTLDITLCAAGAVAADLQANAEYLARGLVGRPRIGSDPGAQCGDQTL